LKRPLLSFVLGLPLLMGGILACAEKGEASQPVSELAEERASLIPPLPEDVPGDVEFKELLSEYQRMNSRLERISGRLRSANRSLCPRTFRDPGFTVHTLEDYAPRLQIVAESLLGVSPNGLYIRSIRRGSPAEDADIEVGDRILKLNGQAIPSGPTMKRFYGALSRGAFGGIKTRLSLRTSEGVDYKTTLKSETMCNYPTSVFYSNAVNGHTNGDEIFITTALMQVVADDVNLALIVAHEMAHAIANHMEQTPSQALELEADRMALIMLERAGYDIESAITYWADAVHPHREHQDKSMSHPTIEARYKNFRDEQKRIEKLKAAQRPLIFATD